MGREFRPMSARVLVESEASGRLAELGLTIELIERVVDTPRQGEKTRFGLGYREEVGEKHGG